jgi:AcrR family transcriptional regulator
MAQTKKPAVREAILAAALQLFSAHGYNATTLSQIARAAGVSTANLYVYFGSKMAILYAIYDPWLRRRLETLAADLPARRTPQAKLRRIVETLWRDIPAEANGFANNIMQAISGAAPGEAYDPSLLRWCEARLATMLAESLPPRRRDALDLRRLAHLIFMAFDGYAMKVHLGTGEGCDRAMVDLFCALVLDEGARRPR